MEIVHRSVWVTLERHDDKKLLVYRRSEVPFPSNDEMSAAFAALGDSLKGVHLEDWRLLLDTRLGPMRNDEAFEKAMKPYRTGFTARFARTATLVKTAVGKLQIARLAREEHREPHAFDDEAEAIAYLVGAEKKSP